MKVLLLSHTPDPDKLVAAAARLCYAPIGADQLLETMTDSQVNKLVQDLLAMGHESPIEHVSFTFAIEGVSRAMSHQLVRHRLASYSQQSQRYVKANAFEYIVPPSVEANPAAKEIFLRQMAAIQQSYDQLSLLGIPKEDARYLLPNACETKIVMTMNARSLYNFFRQRMCQRAQWEIRALATAMRRELIDVSPLLFSRSGPPCETEGYCSQGKMSCGRKPTREYSR
ncbi:MAG: FAD-dependent thymidylate synthase [Negativicutes bacterium]|nr:FAD-dependent thymidylate synthase [Negativicutes bacterium]